MVAKIIILIGVSIVLGIAISKLAIRLLKNSTEIQKWDSAEVKAAKEREWLKGLTMILQLVGTVIALGIILGIQLIMISSQ